MMESDWTNSVLISQTPNFGNNKFTQKITIKQWKNNKNDNPRRCWWTTSTQTKPCTLRFIGAHWGSLTILNFDCNIFFFLLLRNSSLSFIPTTLVSYFWWIFNYSATTLTRWGKSQLRRQRTRSACFQGSQIISCKFKISEKK